MNANSIPQPQALPEDSMLPFTHWRVMELIDGQRSVTAIAHALHQPVSQVLRILEDIEEELGVPHPLQVVPPDPAPPAPVPSPVTPPPQPPAATPQPAQASITGTLTDETLSLLNAIAVHVMGPMGEVLVEDALDELGDDAMLDRIAARVADEMREPQRTNFMNHLRAKGLA